MNKSRKHAIDAVDPVLLAHVAYEHAADVVVRLNDETVEEAACILARLPLDQAVEVFDRPELTRAGELLLELPAPLGGQVLQAMSDDRAADTLRRLEGEDRTRLLSQLDFETAASLKRLLAYPPGTAGSLMTTEFVSVRATATVAETLSHIRDVERSRETVYTICILDPSTRVLMRTVSLRQLIMGEPDQNILAVAPYREPIVVSADTGREEVARLVSVHDLLAVPVVNERRHVQKFGGVEGPVEPYMQIGFRQMIRKRAGWLSILFVSEMLTASALQHFEIELEKAVVLTLFIPLIMSSGGNSGSQATSLLIRALALGQLRLRDWWRVAAREIPTGLTLGAILGFLGMARIGAWQTLGFYDYGPFWPLIALTVGVGVIGIVTFGTTAGSMLPFLLKRLGFDPASASAPLVATLVDVTGLVIYFSVAVVVLRGTLL